MIPYYQTIPELGIKGRFNTPEEFDKIGMPKDLAGWSVLDIGCNMGAFCFEAKKRGANYVRGIDINSEWIEQARRFSGYFEFNGDTISFMESDFLYELMKNYDLILLLSVLHLVSNPQAYLDRAISYTGKLLIVEINDRLQEKPIKLPEDAIFIGKNKDNRSIWHIKK